LIGVFDSGVGGLSVWREMARCMPDVPLMYLADGAHVPYGARPLDEVRQLTLDAAGWLVEHGCDMIVVACNTASAAALDDLRVAFPRTPFVGMEPAVKPAALHTQTGIVGVLATAGTFKSQRYAELISRWANGVRVVERACSGWVEGIENGEWGMGNAESAFSLTISHSAFPIQEHVAPLLAQNADVLVLGCTHFPFLAPQIEQVIADWQATHEDAPAVRLIDPAPAVAQQTLRVWNEIKNLTGRSEAKVQDLSGLSHTFFTTGDATRFSQLASALLGRQVIATAVY
jgi:glutamate racemase